MRGERTLTGASAAASRAAAGASSDEWNGALTGSEHGALGAAGFRSFDRPLHRGGVPGDHHLPGGVEVDRLDHLPLGRLDASGPHRIVVETEQRGHRALAQRDRLLHRLRAQPHEGQRILERERAGGDQRRVLAETVPGDDGGLGPAERAPQRGTRRNPR